VDLTAVVMFHIFLGLSIPSTSTRKHVVGILSPARLIKEYSLETHFLRG
jgi:hypothetical protein